MRKRLPIDIGRYALWRKSEGGRYWTGEAVRGVPVMTTLSTNAQVFPSCTAAYAAAARIKGLQCAKPVRVA